MSERIDRGHIVNARADFCIAGGVLASEFEQPIETTHGYRSITPVMQKSSNNAFLCASPSLSQFASIHRKLPMVVLALIVSLGLGLTFESEVHAADDAKTPTAAATPTHIFLLIGQSNMAGRAKLEAGDDNPISNAWLLTDKSKWEPAANPFNKYASNRKTLSMQRIGPGFGFVLGLKKAMPHQQIGIIGNARGGTKIEEWVKGKPLYDNTIKRLTALDKAMKAGGGKDLKLAGVLWHQGEGNRNDKDYLIKLKKLIESLREDLKSPKLPFIAGKIAKESVINKLLDQLPATVPHTAVVSVEGYKLFDGVHFDRQSQLIIGGRYANAYLKLMEAD